MGLFEWSPLPLDSLTGGTGLVYSPTLERAIYGYDVNIYYTDDGINFTTVSNVNGGGVGSLIWNAAQSKFFLMGSAFPSSGYNFYSSLDGITWTLEVSAQTFTGNFTNFFCSQVGDLYVLTHPGHVYRSASGSSWTDSSNDLDTIDASITTFWEVMFQTAAGLYVTWNRGSVVSIPLATSSDAISWTGQHGFEVDYLAVADVRVVVVTPVGAPLAGTIIAITDGGYIITSTDGIDWDIDFINNVFPDWDPTRRAATLIWSDLFNCYIAVILDVLNEVTYVYTSTDGLSWTLDDSVLPAVDDIFNPPDTISYYTNYVDIENWSRYYMQIATGNSETPVITAPFDNNTMEGDQEIGIEDHSLFGGPGDMIDFNDLGIALLAPYEIVGDIELGIEINPVLIMSADASGLYVLVPNKTNDTIYLRETEDDASVQQLDVAIPDPTLATAYVGG